MTNNDNHASRPEISSREESGILVNRWNVVARAEQNIEVLNRTSESPTPIIELYPAEIVPEQPASGSADDLAKLQARNAVEEAYQGQGEVDYELAA